MMQRIKLSNAFVKLTAVHQPIRLCSTAYYQQPIESHQNSKAKGKVMSDNNKNLYQTSFFPPFQKALQFACLEKLAPYHGRLQKDI